MSLLPESEWNDPWNEIHPEAIEIAQKYPLIQTLMRMETISDDLVLDAELIKLYEASYQLLIPVLTQYDWSKIGEIEVIDSGGEYLMDENFSLVLAALGYVQEEVNDEEFDELLEVLISGPLFSYLLASHTLKRVPGEEEFTSIYDVHVGEEDGEFYEEYEEEGEEQGLSHEAEDDFYVGILLMESLTGIGEEVLMGKEIDEIMYLYGQVKSNEVVAPFVSDKRRRFEGPVTAGEMHEASKPPGHILN